MPRIFVAVPRARIAGRVFAFVLACWSLPAGVAQGALDPERVHRAEGRKTEVYIREGIFAGGDRSVESVTVTGLRRGNNGRFERVVIDLGASRAGDPVALARAPFFQAGVRAKPRRVSLTLWGSPTLAFDTRRVQREFRQSRVIRRLELLPNLDGESWTFAMDLREDAAVEAFHLSDPARIIVDIRSK
jgi:hypothetical protein